MFDTRSNLALARDPPELMMSAQGKWRGALARAISRLRAIPLPEVLNALGFERDKAKWKAEEFAISLTQLRVVDGEHDFTVISASGITPKPRPWFAKLAADARRICGYDNDKSGDQAGRSLQRHGFECLRPTGKDWNDDLKQVIRGQAQAGGKDAAPPAPTSEPDNTPSPFD